MTETVPAILAGRARIIAAPLRSELLAVVLADAALIGAVVLG